MGCVDARTSEVLQEIIQETTNRMGRMQQQASQNEIAEAKLAGLIDIERKRTELIEAQTDNEKKRATMEGEAQGLLLANSALSFFDLLNSSVPSVEAKLELLRFFEEQRTAVVRMQSLASGNATLFVTPQDMQLKMQMPTPSIAGQPL